MLRQAGQSALRWIPPLSRAGKEQQAEAAHAMSMFAMGGTSMQRSYTPWGSGTLSVQQPLLPYLVHRDRDEDQASKRSTTQNLLLGTTLSPSAAALLAFRQQAHLSPALGLVHNHRDLLLDISGRRHISFFRFLSVGNPTPKKSPVPDAADTDAAMADYLELRSRLDRLEKPASIRTTPQVIKDALAGMGRGLVVVFQFLMSIPGRIAEWRAMTPEDWAKWKKETWATIKHEAHHYWVGTKLLGYEVRIASRHALKAAQGKQLSRRERAQLTRTTADLFRLVPMIIIIVIPFLEFFLPLLLRIFPNMLPSTFEDKLKKEEELKRRLSVRLELAKFLQDTVAEMATDIARRKGTASDAQDLQLFITKVRAGQPVENADIIRFARLFNDELTLDHLDRLQLVSMCQFVGISPFGTDAFLITRLRQHLQKIKQDDFVIEQEGLENLTEDELRSACRARGMRAPYGEGAQKFMQRQMQDWLDLSLHRGLPSSLLLLSRAFTITAPGPALDVSAAKDAKYEKLKETLGVIPEQVVDSLAVERLGSGSGVEALQQRLEFLKREEEAIHAELQRAEAAARAAALAEAAMVKAVQEGMALGTPAAASTKTPTLGLTPAATTSTSGTETVAAAQVTPDVTPDVSLIAPEEAAQAAAQAKERRLKAVIDSLMDMATKSAVAKERTVFMELMKREMDRANAALVERGKGSSTGTMRFSAGGLEVAKDSVADEEAAAADGARPAQVAPSRLSERVSRMLTRIEAELDAVESKIGERLHILDTDADGKITADEIERALTYLREQLSPQDMTDLLAHMKKAAASSASQADGDGGDHIELSGLLSLATDEKSAAGGSSSPAGGETAASGSPAGQPAVKQVASTK